jgi:hypothetical protein
MNSQRYRLEGFRYQNGQVRVQPRPVKPSDAQREDTSAVLVTERFVVSTVR